MDEDLIQESTTQLPEAVESESSFWTFLQEPLVLGETVLPFSIVSIIIEFILPFLAILLVSVLLRRTFTGLIGKSEIQDKTKNRISNINKWVFRLIPIIAFVLLLARILGAEIFQFLQFVVRFFSDPLYVSGDVQISIITILSLIPIFYIASWAGKGARIFINNTLIKRLPLDEARKFSMLSLIRYFVMAVVLLLGLSFVGINVSSLVVLLGVLGIGIGIGLQGMVANFFAGLIIIFTRPIKEGDFIQVETSGISYEGSVKQIRLLNSVVLTLKNETLIVPNSGIITNTIHNNSYNDPSIIITAQVPVSYETDVDQAMELIKAICKDNPHGLKKTIKGNKEGDIEVRLLNFAASSIELEVRFWISPASAKLEALAWFNLEVWRQFKSKGLHFPYPQLDIHMDRKRDYDS